MAVDDAFLNELIDELDRDHVEIKRDVMMKLSNADPAFQQRCLRALDALYGAGKAEIAAEAARAMARAAAASSIGRDQVVVFKAVSDANRLSGSAARLRDAAKELQKIAQPFVNEVIGK